MTFRKDAILFLELEIYCCIMALLSLGLTILLNGFFFFIFLLLFILLAFVIPNLLNEFITIDRNGVSCNQKGILQWSYTWEQIAEFRESSRFRMPSVEIVVLKETGLPEDYAAPMHYFQLGKDAKRALKRYNS